MPVSIRGKPYMPVSERVQAAHEDLGFEIVGADIFTIGETGRWWFQATIRVIRVGDAQLYRGTAEIKFNAAPNSPDGTNPVECAETSAVGRALGFAGYGLVDGIASADEVLRAEARQEPREPRRETSPAPQPAKDDRDDGERPGANTAQLNAIAKLSQELGTPLPEVTGFDQANETIKRLSLLKRERMAKAR